MTRLIIVAKTEPMLLIIVAKTEPMLLSFPEMWGVAIIVDLWPLNGSQFALHGVCTFITDKDLLRRHFHLITLYNLNKLLNQEIHSLYLLSLLWVLNESFRIWLSKHKMSRTETRC